jgi:hypothetical protein
MRCGLRNVRGWDEECAQVKSLCCWEAQRLESFAAAWLGKRYLIRTQKGGTLGWIGIKDTGCQFEVPRKRANP